MKAKYYFIIIWSAIILFWIIGLSIFIFSDDGSSNYITKSCEIEFSELNETVYIKGLAWGLLGQHVRIQLSTKPFLVDNTDSSTQYVFYTDELYYKVVEPDSLILYVWNIVDVPPSINSDINIYQYLITDKKLIENYQDYGISFFGIHHSNQHNYQNNLIVIRDTTLLNINHIDKRDIIDSLFTFDHYMNMITTYRVNVNNIDYNFALRNDTVSYITTSDTNFISPEGLKVGDSYTQFLSHSVDGSGWYDPGYGCVLQLKSGWWVYFYPQSSLYNLDDKDDIHILLETSINPLALYMFIKN